MTKIGFILLSNSKEPAPSTRVSVLNVIPLLRKAGFEPHIVYEPASPTETPELPDLATSLHSSGFKIVYFQKVHGKSVENLAQELRRKGIKTVYGVCDLVNSAMAELTDATITVTEYLRQLYPEHLWKRIHVVHDGIERPDVVKTFPSLSSRTASRNLHAVLVTSSALDSLPAIHLVPPRFRLTIVGRYAPTVKGRLSDLRWKIRAKQTGERVSYLQFLLNPRIRCISWSQQNSYAAMWNADVGIIPIDTSGDSSAIATHPPAWKVKSENRLTMKMAIGLPVIATPIPSYEPIIQHGLNGFFASSRDDWIGRIEELRDPVRRRQMGALARESVLEKYSMTEQARRLVAVLHSL